MMMMITMGIKRTMKILMTMIDYIDDDNGDDNDGDDIDREVKPNWSARAHVEGGGNFAGEGGGGEQGRWETCAKYRDNFADVCKRNLFCECMISVKTSAKH